MTVKIGITGGIGSGKSVVSRLLEVMGIPVYISDGETKQLMMTDSCIRSELTALLGEEVYVGGVLNKSLLASYLFGSPEHAGQINGIVHPRVKEDFRQWVCQRAACRMAGIESAILIEAGFADEVDVVVMVYAPEEIRVQRAMKRDASSRELIEKRIRSQMSDEEKRFVIRAQTQAMLLEDRAIFYSGPEYKPFNDEQDWYWAKKTRIIREAVPGAETKIAAVQLMAYHSRKYKPFRRKWACFLLRSIRNGW